MSESAARTAVIYEVLAVAVDCENEGWDGEEGVSISSLVINHAMNFIRSLPDDVPSPEVAPEPDGSISFDWISSRNRIFSVSVGLDDRLAFAWIDGTDSGHGVTHRDAIAPRMLDIIRRIADGGSAVGSAC
jgi:hypothetical protein